MNYYKQLRRFSLSKWLLLILAALLFSVTVGVFSQAQVSAESKENTVNLYLFWGDGCPHCAHAKETLEPYAADHANINYYPFEVYYSSKNQQYMQAIGEKLNIEASGVPLIIVGDKSYLGYSDTTGYEIISRLTYCSTNACSDSVASIVGVETPEARDIDQTEASEDETADESTVYGAGQSDVDPSRRETDANIISLPVLGEINAAEYSLPVLTVIFGLLDGFNPCAMWALLFIITLLIGMNDRKKMWLFGTTFIAVSALVYFVFMAAWLNLFLFIGHIVWIRTAIGLLAVGVGAYYLYEWHLNRTGCKITGNEKRRAVFEKLREIVKQKNVWLALGGIALLAAAVNVVELACSAGLPVIYTGILSASGLETTQYYAYMLLYIFFFMLDDLVVFAIAMTSFKIIGIDSKYTRATRFVGGIIMLILGLLLIVAPEVLMFG
ncbi:hypothetical protein EOL96_05955 [Candidatus Saccharibacteria bacterium]|nr:hypothetical protein [Candidatus Saccharibacteria bacterium]